MNMSSIRNLLVERRGDNLCVRELAAGRGGLGHAEIHSCGPCCAEIPVGTGVLNFVESLPEHGVVSLFPIEKKINGFLDLLIVDLAVQILIDNLCSLLGGDVGQQIGAEVAGYRDVVACPGIAGGIDEPGVQAKQNVGLDLSSRNLIGIHIMTI